MAQVTYSTTYLIGLLDRMIKQRTVALVGAMRQGQDITDLENQLAYVLLLRQAAPWATVEQVKNLIHPLTSLPNV